MLLLFGCVVVCLGVIVCSVRVLVLWCVVVLLCCCVVVMFWCCDVGRCFVAL